jgi:hypothetical protein
MPEEVAVVEVETPSQADAMSTSTKSVKVDVGGMTTTAKLANVLAITVAGTIALAVSAVLADGTSVIRLKDPQYLPKATNPALKSQGLNYRLDELLGPTYGIGLHHDQSGHTWTAAGAGSTLADLIKNLGVPAVIAAVPSVIATDDLKHPVPFLSCDHLQMAGLAAMSLGFIAEVVAVLMVIFHAVVLAGLVPAKPAKQIAGLVWFVLSAGFATVICLAVGIYTSKWTCNQPVIPSIVLSDHFEYNYGFPFAIVGFVASLLVLFVTLSATSTKESDAAPKVASIAAKTVGGTFVGCAVAAVACVIILGANGSFAAKADPDPNVNPCEGQKPKHAGPGDKYFSNVDCMKDNVVQTLEQAGANVTKGYKGKLDAGNRVPITGHYRDHGLCPVNVHWHLGAEHLSVGQFDEHGKGPYDPAAHRQLAAGSTVRLGHQCHHYNAADPKFTKPYDWKYCTNMQVGQTYEIHWPHSAAGACGTPWAMQTPFYDGVFCKDGVITIAPLNTYEKIGVQSQTFVIVNDESYKKDNLIAGAIEGNGFWEDVAMYTGSTTGTSRDNNVCSRYTPITWQVDRKCHIVSASTFDNLCKDMKAQKDDMSGDFYPHGSRITTADKITANNQQSRA